MLDAAVYRTSLGLVLFAACGGDDVSNADADTTSASTSGEGSSDTTAGAEASGSAATGSAGTDATLDGSSSGSTGESATGRVHVVLFTHIEDASPPGTLGTEENRTAYLGLRTSLIEMAELAGSHDLQWVLQPDWKILLAALQYEDAETTASTGGKNFLVYLRDDLGVVIDPHSHEAGGYNYTDVAHLLELLEVGGSTVIGGHVWDPALPQFQEWDRFREPVNGIAYPESVWRGDILIGAGTPNHVNDPIVSGVWRPLDRDNFFMDDPAGNIACVGAFRDEVSGVQELVELYASGTVAPEHLLTASWNLTPIEITAPNGLSDIEQAVLVPIAEMRDAGEIVVTDFTSLVEIWQSQYGAEAFLHQR